MTSQETLVPRGRLRAVQEQWVDQSQIETRVIELRSTAVHYLNYHFLQLINDTVIESANYVNLNQLTFAPVYNKHE